MARSPAALEEVVKETATRTERMRVLVMVIFIFIGTVFVGLLVAAFWICERKMEVLG